ncbi:intraflagellar transport protein 172 homolog [Lepeophtheirus salmonis]
MQLKYMKNLLECQDGAAKINCLTWSPNNLKLAVCTADRVILLFDETGEKRDKFSTKPADPKYGKRSYSVRGLQFSPDSTKLAVGQTDNIVFVYKVGEDWKDKKVICNKFVQTSAVTCLAWPSQGPIVIGLADGKIRTAHTKNNKASTMYSTDSFTVAIAVNSAGTGFLSGHLDGSIVRFYVAEDSNAYPQGKVMIHGNPPYALSWTHNHIVVAGCDKKVVFYSQEGNMFQQFDYFRDKNEKEFTVSISSPAGQAVCIGSFNRIRIYAWNNHKNLWEEKIAKEMPNVYTITALDWKCDGSRIVSGSLCGGVELFESVLRRSVWKNKFEITYVGSSQVLVKPLMKRARGVILKSIYGHDIEDVRIMGGDNYIIARTPETMLLGDMNKNLLSEIPWMNSGGNEKFYFESNNVCMVFNAGELNLVEYGKNELIGSVRTEFMNPHLISVRINERRQKGVENNKKLAYLLDLKTIALEDLVFGYSLGQITHDSKIDWLELNETGQRLLFRDKRSRLNLVDIETMYKTSILNFCTFVQWVPGSDVVVAQSRDQMGVWYNIDSPERVTLFPIKGDVVEVLREDGKTEVIVQEGHHQLSYQLDEGLIEFGTALDDGDFNRAITYLESLGNNIEAEAMWKTLAKLSLENKHLHVAEKCCAALGDVSKAKYLRETLNLADAHAVINEESGLQSDGMDSPDVWARLCILDKQFKAAEGIYLEQNKLDEAIGMYTRLNMWEEALNLAEAKGHPELDTLRNTHFKWLLETGQEEKAGSIKESEDKYMDALNLYLRAGLATRASRLVQSHNNLIEDSDTVDRVTSALLRGEFYEQAGELFEKTRQDDKALDCFRKGQSFNRAVELARYLFPSEVVVLEEEWGDYLVSNKQLDAAINHYIEAGRTLKALEAAINAKQWNKAVQIISVIDDGESGELNKYYFKLGGHYASIKEYKMAETFYLKGGMEKIAIEMYNSVAKWEEAHSLASRFMDTNEVTDMYVDQAQKLEEDGRFKEAEKLYISVREPDFAISMYKKQRQYDNMVRLVEAYHPDLVNSTHVHLAQELEQEGNHRAAEQHFLQAGDWKSVVHMYRGNDLWEEAYRVAQNKGGANAAKQVAFLWAKTLGGESAVKLLNKFGILEDGIEYACESYHFEFAFELAKLGAVEKTIDIHYKFAMALEDDGKFKEAEDEFVKAKRPKEAVLMYVHNQDWESAQRVAEEHDQSSVAEVLVGQAKVAFESKDFPKFESLLLRAKKSELAIKLYKSSDMWADALRVCREYSPHNLTELQREYDSISSNDKNKNMDGLISQALQWESNGDYERAIECYLRVDESNTNGDLKTVSSAWTSAAELAVKFLDISKAENVAKIVGPKLVGIQSYNPAAQMYLSIEMINEAIDVFIKAGEWGKAKKVAKELEPRLESYIDQRYKDFLKNEGKAEQLVSVDLNSALDMYVEQGNWSKALDTASTHGPEILHKYIALYATQLIRSQQSVNALHLYKKFGTPANPQNFNIYKKISMDIFSLKKCDFDTWSMLRDVLYDLSDNINKAPSSISKAAHEDFKLLLLISHFGTLRSVCQNHQQLKEISTKLSISLLRYSDVIPADKAFYEAGTDCRDIGWDNMAFVFLNRYLDLYEAMEEGSLDMLDNSDFVDTDVPFQVPLPETPYLSESEHDRIKEWVLAVSMDQKVEQQLPLDERMTYEASLVAVGTGVISPTCIITGYPVLGNKIEFSHGMVANKEDWNKFVMTSKMITDNDIQNIIQFLSSWSGMGNLTPGFAFQ